MIKKRLYSIQLKNRESDPEGKLLWYCPVCAQFVSKEFTRGYVSCCKGYYPCPDIKIVDAYTEEVVEEITGNGKVTVNTN